MEHKSVEYRKKKLIDLNVLILSTINVNFFPHIIKNFNNTLRKYDVSNLELRSLKLFQKSFKLI